MTKKALHYILYLTISAILLTSCHGYQKVLKSNDYNLKYEKALEYYQKGDYYRALNLFEDVMNILKGSDKGENALYCYADCHYQQEDYVMAAYYFDNFANTFPYSEKTPMATYLTAYCYYLNSPKSSLDQSDTRKAIDAMQLYINKYPDSEKIDEANNIIEELRAKLEEKSFENAKLYYKLGEYHASNIALKNSIKDFPDTEYREEILYLIVKSSFLLAENSISNKQGERYQNTITEYYSFIDEFPKSEYIKEIEKMYEKSVNQIKKQ